MIPSQCSSAVPIWQLKLKSSIALFEIQYITAKISTQEQAIPLRKLVIDFCIQVIKKVIRASEVGLVDKWLSEIETIRPASADQETALAFHNRSL